jgi:hypothetical protein
MSGETMSQSMRSCGLGYAGALGRGFDGALEQALVDMVPAHARKPEKQKPGVFVVTLILIKSGGRS